MLITKFNAMIRNRFVWTVFAIIVSISFLGFLGPRASCRRYAATAREAGAVGVINGKSVQSSEFYQAQQYELGLRSENAPRTDSALKKLRERTWKRIAALRAASDLGISVPDAELGEMIRRDPAFKVNNAFNKDRYQSVIQQQLRVNVDMFEDYLRESLVLRKLVETLRSAIWTGPSELSQRLHNLTDTMVAETVTLEPDPSKDMRDATEKDAERYFAANKESFTIPARVSVRYVEFPVTNYYSTNDVTDAQVQEYYSDHTEQYSTTDTNGASVEVPIEKVRPEIVHKLADAGAVYKARDAATEFSIQMIPDRNGQAMSFDEASARSSLTIRTTDLFSADEEIAAIQGSEAFAEAALRLSSNDVERMVSDPVGVSNVVYVMTLAQRIEPQIPEFSQIRDKALSLARTNAMEKAFEERAQKYRDALADALQAGKAFSPAAREMGLSVTTTTPFTVYEAMQTNTFAHAESVVPRIASLQTNEVSDLVAISNGYVIAALTKREPADLVTVDSMRPQLLSAIEGYRAGTLFDDWAAGLLREGKFEDYVAIEESKSTEETPPLPPEDGERPAGKPSKDQMQQLL